MYLVELFYADGASGEQDSVGDRKIHRYVPVSRAVVFGVSLAMK